MKEKMLLKLERDRLIAKNEALQKSLQNIEDKLGKEGNNSPTELPKIDVKDTALKSPTKVDKNGTTKNKTGPKPTPFPADDRPNPYSGLSFETHP